MDLESGFPKDELAPETLSWFKTLGVEYKKLSEVLAAGPCPKVSFGTSTIQHFDSKTRIARRNSNFPLKLRCSK